MPLITDWDQDPSEFTKYDRGTTTYLPPAGGSTMGFGGGSASLSQRSPFQNALAPWRRRYGQAYGGMAKRGAQPTGAATSSAFSAARSSTPMGSIFNRQRAGRGVNVPAIPGAEGGTGTGATAGTDYSSNPNQALIDSFNMGDKANYSQLTYAAIMDMIRQGMLNPNGSAPMISALRGQAVGDADALRARSNTLSQLSGLDPAQAASGYFQRDMGLDGEIQRMLLNARLQSMLQNRELLTGMLGKGIGYNFSGTKA